MTMTPYPNRVGSYILLPWRKNIYTKYFVNFFSHYFYQYELTDMYFMLWVIIQSNFICFLAQILTLAIRLSVDFCVLLTPPAPPTMSMVWGVFFVYLFLFLSTSLFSGTTRCSRLIMFNSSPSPKYFKHSFKDPWFLLLENDIKSQDLSGKRSYCFSSVIASRPFQLTEQVNTHVYTKPRICSHL